MDTGKKADTVQLEAAETASRDGSQTAFLSDVAKATDAEHRMSGWQALKLYPKATAWSVALSSCLIMEGYDNALISTFYGFPSFAKRFGKLSSDGTYQVSAAWQTGLSDGAQIGSILGLLVTGTLAERFGFRKVILGALIAIFAIIFLEFFAVNIIMLQVAYVLIGIPWGMFQTSTTAYASEVCPVHLRPFLTTFVNLCWVVGQLIAAGVLRGFSTAPASDDLAWRIPYAIQWIWPIPIGIAVFFAPESPWWLVRHDKIPEAERAVRRLTSSDKNSGVSVDITQTIALMKHTNEMEKAAVAGTSYLDCFRGVNLRRTEIACMVWSIQNLCGNSLIGYSTYFLEQAGLPTTESFNMSIGMSGLGFVGTVLSWFLMSRIGRRTLYTWGLVILGILCLIIGIIAAATDSIAGSWATGALIVAFTGFYDMTIGPVCYSLVAELPSTRLRPKTIVLARSVYNVFGIMDGALMPYMINPTAWNWKGKTGFFWAGFCFVLAVYCYFRLPEPSGKTYGELDILFEKKVSARKFGKAQVDAVHETVEKTED